MSGAVRSCTLGGYVTGVISLSSGIILLSRALWTRTVGIS